MTRRPVLLLALLGLGCGKHLDPPGATLEQSARVTVTEVRADGTVLGPSTLPLSAGAVSSAGTPAASANGPAPGSADDNLPFTPDGLDLVVQPDWLEGRGWYRP